MITPPCPACGSVDVARRGPIAHCRTCESDFPVAAEDVPVVAPPASLGADPAVSGAAPLIDVPKPTGSPPTPSAATSVESEVAASRGLVLWLVVSLGVLGGAAGLLYSVTPGGGAPEHTSVSPGRRAVDPSAPLVELESVRRGRDSAGDPFWLVTWTNRSDEVFVAPTVIVELLDDEGKVVRTESGRGLHDRVDPGASTWIHVPVPDAPAFEDATVKVAGPYRPDARIDQVRLFVDGAGMVSTPEGDVVRAKVRVPGNHAVRVGRVAAVGFGADGFVSAWAEGTPPADPLQPLVTLEVEIPVGSQVAQPATVWTLVAVGLEDR